MGVPHSGECSYADLASSLAHLENDLSHVLIVCRMVSSVSGWVRFQTFVPASHALADSVQGIRPGCQIADVLGCRKRLDHVVERGSRQIGHGSQGIVGRTARIGVRIAGELDATGKTRQRRVVVAGNQERRPLRRRV